MADELIDALQWPAMLLTIVAAWFLGSPSAVKRGIGFWGMLASNVVWAVWGWHDGASALVGLQFCLAALNIRGAFKAEEQAEAKPPGAES